MSDIVNLRRFKKRAARVESAKQAETNRARFGRTLSERALDEKRTAQAAKMVDQHRIESEDGP